MSDNKRCLNQNHVAWQQKKTVEKKENSFFLLNNTEKSKNIKEKNRFAQERITKIYSLWSRDWNERNGTNFNEKEWKNLEKKGECKYPTQNENSSNLHTQKIYCYTQVAHSILNENKHFFIFPMKPKVDFKR